MAVNSPRPATTGSGVTVAVSQEDTFSAVRPPTATGVDIAVSRKLFSGLSFACRRRNSALRAPQSNVKERSPMSQALEVVLGRDNLVGRQNLDPLAEDLEGVGPERDSAL